MSESYDTLFHAYNRLQAKVKDLEEQLSQKQHQWSERDSEDDITDRMVRELCEDILSRQKQRTEKNHSWSKMSLNDLVREAKRGFAEYAATNRETLSSVLNTAEERRIMIEGLENQISVMKQNPGNTTITQEEIQAALKKEKEQEEFRAKAGHKIRTAIDNGQIKVATDDTDEFDDMEKELYQVSMEISERAKVTPKSIPKTESKKRAEQIKKFKQTAQSNMYLEDLKEYEKELKPIEWELLQLIGSTGVSIQKDIVEELMKKDVEYRDSTIRNCIKRLFNMHLLAKETVVTPLRGTLILFRLDEKGVIIYQMKFGKEPVKSEMERIIAEHDSYAHGYGILEIASILKEKPYYKSVKHMNRNNPIRLSEGSSVVPDIICTDMNGTQMFIEYECGNHNQTNFSSKCSKLCKIDKYVNIIAPNDAALKKLMEQVEKWMKSKGSSIARYTIRLTTSSTIKDKDLRKNAGWKVLYFPEKGLTPVMNF